MSDRLEDALKEFLRDAKDWDRKPTTVPGIFILKLPKYKKTPPRLVVEINPVDDYGRPTKRRGLILRDLDDLNRYKALIENERLERLMKVLDKVNPEVSKKGVEGALEI